MRPHLVIAVASVALIAGCTSDDDDTTSSTSAASEVQSSIAPPTAAPTIDGAPFTVESLGLAFQLPESFVAVDNADFVFLARSMSPQSVFSIDSDVPTVVTDNPAEPGESLSEIDVGTADAVVVTDAVIEGLPPGVSSNELVVSNGEKSFTVIMSASTADLSEMWDVFIGSVTATPAD